MKGGLLPYVVVVVINTETTGDEMRFSILLCYNLLSSALLCSALLCSTLLYPTLRPRPVLPDSLSSHPSAPQVPDPKWRRRLTLDEKDLERERAKLYAEYASACNVPLQGSVSRIATNVVVRPDCLSVS